MGMFSDLSLFDLMLSIAAVMLPSVGLVSIALLLIFDRRKMKQEQKAGQHQQWFGRPKVKARLWFALFMLVLLLNDVISSLGLAHHPLPSLVARLLLVACFLALLLPLLLSIWKASKQQREEAATRGSQGE